MVLFGIDECGRGTFNRFDRQKFDLDNVASVLSSIVPSIQSQSIKDSLRLGKFNSSSRPRPILVKFIRSVDVTNILANRWSLFPPYSLKPDLSPTERLKESILLKERWKLIQYIKTSRSKMIDSLCMVMFLVN